MYELIKPWFWRKKLLTETEYEKLTAKQRARYKKYNTFAEQLAIDRAVLNRAVQIHGNYLPGAYHSHAPESKKQDDDVYLPASSPIFPSFDFGSNNNADNSPAPDAPSFEGFGGGDGGGGGASSDF